VTRRAIHLLGSAGASPAGDGALAITNFSRSELLTSIFHLLVPRPRDQPLGSTSVSGVGFGVSPKHSSLTFELSFNSQRKKSQLIEPRLRIVAPVAGEAVSFPCGFSAWN
jgi:hypothetical protein